MHKQLRVGAFILMIALMGSGCSNQGICPWPNQITQIKAPDQIPGQPYDPDKGGYFYRAPAGHGAEWVGHNPEAQPEDLATFKFTGGLYRDVSSQGNTNVVSCDYEGDAWLAFARMTLYSFRDWAGPANTRWKYHPVEQAKKASTNPQWTATCDSTDPLKCTFTYTKLEAPSPQRPESVTRPKK